MKKGVYINTSLRWNSMWSHGHELTKILSKNYRTFFYEPPFCKGNVILEDKHQYPKPKGCKFISTSKKFNSLGIKYMRHYLFHTTQAFKENEDDFDIFLTYNVYEIANLNRAKKKDKKVIFVYADEYDELTTMPLLKPYLKYALKQFLLKSDMVVCTARTLEAKAKKLNKNVVYLPNAVDLSDVKKSRLANTVKKVKSTKITKKSNDVFKIGFLGAMEHWVNYHIMVDAAKELSEKNNQRNKGTKNSKKFLFEIVGDGASMPAFKKAVSDAELSSMFIFTGRVPHERVYDYISSWDLAVIPFHINTITDSVSPVKLFEYWLLAKPVAATKTKELSQFNKELMLFDSSEELVRNVHKLALSQKLGNKLGEAGKKLVVTKYNWGNYEKIYKKLIDKLLIT